MAVRSRLAGLILVALLGLVINELAFVGPPSLSGRQNLARLRAVDELVKEEVKVMEKVKEVTIESKEETPKHDELFGLGEFFSTDLTSGGAFWLWLIVPSFVLFYVYLDLVFGERCGQASSYLNGGGAYCMSESILGGAFDKLAQTHIG